MILCDICKFALTDDYQGTTVKQSLCEPGYGSQYDSTGEIFVSLPNGEYCYNCLDSLIDTTPVSHLLPRFKCEAFDRLINCQCDIHSGIRQRGGEQLLAMLRKLS